MADEPRTIDITPHPALGVAHDCVEMLKVNGFDLTDEDGQNIEGLALVAIAGVLLVQERQGHIMFGVGLDTLAANMAGQAD